MKKQKRLKYKESIKPIGVDGKRESKYFNKCYNSIFNMGRGWFCISCLFKSISKYFGINNSSDRSDIYFSNNISIKLDGKEDRIMPRYKTSTKIKIWFKNNWQIILAMALMLWFFYLLTNN